MTIFKEIPVMRPIGPPLMKVMKYLYKINKAHIFSNNGPLVQMYEKRLSKFLNTKPESLVTCVNATMALFGALKILNYKSITIPSFTFTASGLSAIVQDYEIEFADINIETLEVSLSQEYNSTDVIMYVLPFGQKLTPDLKSVFSKFRFVLIDAAASLGNTDIDLSELPKNCAVVFSLHSTKVLGSGEGGIIVFGDDELAQKFRYFINFGFVNSRESAFLGLNLKMSEYTAAIGLASLDNWKSELQEWQESRFYVQEIEERYQLKSFSTLFAGANPYWIVRLENPIINDSLQKEFKHLNIQTRKWWPTGLHRMQAFNKIGSGSSLPNTDLAEISILGLPFMRKFKRQDLKRMSMAFEKIFD
jgi:dTDP-4-amino-4,6-dideoxygalactose transaminase